MIHTPAAEFIVVETDPFVLLDIQETIVRTFGVEPNMVETLDALPTVLDDSEGPIVIISSHNITQVTDILHGSPTIVRKTAAVLIADAPVEHDSAGLRTTFVSAPFSSEILERALKNALESLLTIQS